MQPWFTMYLFGIRHPCYDQSTPVKTRYPLTSITWPYRGLKFTAHRSGVFFLKLTADQVLVFVWIACSSHVNLLNTGWIVRKSVNANPGLKVNRSINLSSIQVFLTALGSGLLVWFEIIEKQKEGQKYKQKTSPQSCKTQIKIVAYPGLT